MPMLIFHISNIYTTMPLRPIIYSLCLFLNDMENLVCSPLQGFDMIRKEGHVSDRIWKEMGACITFLIYYTVSSTAQTSSR